MINLKSFLNTDKRPAKAWIASGLLAVFAVAIASYFWTDSRYPALEKKFLKGVTTPISGIAFDILWSLEPGDPFFTRVIKNSVNWAYSNWKGMTFGLIFAAVLFVLLPNLLRRKSWNSFSGGVLGVTMGAPLGLCANCSTPVANSLMTNGFHPTAAIALIFASPTLNPVVISMMLDAFPLWVVIAKICFTLAFIFLAVPVLMKVAPPQHLTKGECRIPLIDRLLNKQNPVISAPTSFFLALVLIVRTTLPLMLLAGVLGSFVVEIVSLTQLDIREPSWIQVLGITLVGLFLPVPMTFDVVLSSQLQILNADPRIVYSLLFSLGIFSIYPFTVLLNNYSWKFVTSLGAILLAALFGVSMASGHYQLSRDAAYFSLYQINSSEQILATASRECKNETKCVDRILELKAVRAADIAICGSHSFPDKCTRSVSRRIRFDEAANCVGKFRDIADTDRCYENNLRAMAALEFSSLFHGYCETNYTYKSETQPAPEVKCRKLESLAFAKDSLRPELCEIREGTGAVSEEYRQLCIEAIKYRELKENKSAGLPACKSFKEEIIRYACETNMIARHSDISACLYAENVAHCLAFAQMTGRSNSECDIFGPELGPVCRFFISESRFLESQSAPALAKIVSDWVAPPKRYVAIAETKSEPRVSERIGFLQIESQKLRARSGEEKRFVLFTGKERGLTTQPFLVSDFYKEFIRGRGLAAGDFNNDGWIDLAIGQPLGIGIYQNVGGGHFQQVCPKACDSFTLSSTQSPVFADLDNDGYLDLIFGVHGESPAVIWNSASGFKEASRIWDRRIYHAPAIAVADLNHDGSNDIAIGVSGPDPAKPSSYENVVLINGGNRKFFRWDQYTDQSFGRTLSVLISDLFNNGKPQLIFGNDREDADEVFKINGSGSLQRITDQDQLFPHTALNTMSLDSADVNGDGLLDLWTVDIDYRTTGKMDWCELITDHAEKTECESVFAADKGLQNGNSLACESLAAPWQRADCRAIQLARVAIRNQKASLCHVLPPSMAKIQQLCLSKVGEVKTSGRIRPSDVPQVNRNVLLIQQPGGKYKDETKARGLEKTYFTWNSRFFDFDLDGWLDVYSVTGGYRSRQTPNVAHRNTGSGNFEDVSSAWGLDESINAGAFVAEDFDNDGDLDIITLASYRPAHFYENRLVAGNLVQIEIQDNVGARQPALARIEVTDETGAVQVREVQLSGGFMSRGSNIMTFGLGQARQARSLKIRWPDGDVSSLNKPLNAQERYRITRLK